MAKLGDLSCASCGRPMYRSWSSSLPQGEATCLPCRRQRHVVEPERRSCATCGDPFIPKSSAHRYCSDQCRPRRTANTTRRGYGAAHQRERKRWAPVVASGRAVCMETYCFMTDRAIEPGEPWELAHDHDGADRYKGPAHRLCNRREQQIRAGFIDAPVEFLVP